MTDRPVRAVDLPPEHYPMTIRILDKATRAERWSAVVAGPGVLDIPGKNITNQDQPVIARIEYGNGDVEEVG